jgi:hypothetical protein
MLPTRPAALPSAAKTPDQGAGRTAEKMGACSADFKKTGQGEQRAPGLHVDCLKKEDPKAAQQEKMKTCSADFKESRQGGQRPAGVQGKECLTTWRGPRGASGC